MKILKLVVTRSSSLQVVPSTTTSSYDHSHHFFQNIHGSYSDSEVCKKELAGRTMDFSYDTSQTPLIGRRLLLKPDLEIVSTQAAKMSQPLNLNSANNLSGTPNSPRRSASLSPADTTPLMSGWKRPWMSQSRVRECLVNLLTTCGQRVGLPKSPSVSLYQYCFNQKNCACSFAFSCGFIFIFRTTYEHDFSTNFFHTIFLICFFIPCCLFIEWRMIF